ncbi:hypothetical protein ANO14919_136140 [Xylariales sp. No.14919]|nr:hypothetical protein ANO14919_136140 [Xylariales sp. No.14919]
MLTKTCYLHEVFKLTLELDVMHPSYMVAGRKGVRQPSSKSSPCGESTETMHIEA